MNKSTRKLTIMAMLVAVSIVLVYLIHFPIFPAAPFLEYDPADIPILVGTFAFGPVAGFLLTLVTCIIQGVTVSAGSGAYGIIMHLIATTTMVLIAGNIYRVKHTKAGAAIGLIIGTICWGIVMCIANHFITPLFMGVPVEAVDAMIIPIILPFNLIKAGVNSAITFVIYKTISRHIIHRGEEKTES
ncbi:MAG: ECF transporter S component [Ruminiclostridium sp.]|nr:ECF transporter S component [Ruminiclostridium sp.]